VLLDILRPLIGLGRSHFLEEVAAEALIRFSLHGSVEWSRDLTSALDEFVLGKKVLVSFLSATGSR